MFLYMFLDTSKYTLNIVKHLIIGKPNSLDMITFRKALIAFLVRPKAFWIIMNFSINFNDEL